MPITGCECCFSGSCRHRSRYILGVGAKIFTIAGPVILYGISAGVVYGVIYWLMDFI